MNHPISKQVRALYMEDSQDKHSTRITNLGFSEINKINYNWIELSETIFHPKGGGQPSDEGLIAELKVAYVHKEFFDKNHLDQFKIFHCFEADQPFPFKIGDEVELVVETCTRLLHSRLHSAGHLLAEAVNQCFPELEGYQGNHYPNNSYVKFKISSPMSVESKDEIKERTEREINFWIDQDLKITELMEPSGVRMVKIYKNWTPCGGTHIRSLKEIGEMQITDISINKKEGTITIKYVA